MAQHVGYGLDRSVETLGCTRHVLAVGEDIAFDHQPRVLLILVGLGLGSHDDHPVIGIVSGI